jgi:hypothetical protein
MSSALWAAVAYVVVFAVIGLLLARRYPEHERKEREEEEVIRQIEARQAMK